MAAKSDMAPRTIDNTVECFRPYPMATSPIAASGNAKKPFD
ncbi:MAG: hypothetical protein VX016_08695 [Verrucomicrobiota bacterium]|nr:hypothetical protein [Verrucomicrobiota bacterium]